MEVFIPVIKFWNWDRRPAWLVEVLQKLILNSRNRNLYEKITLEGYCIIV